MKSKIIAGFNYNYKSYRIYVINNEIKFGYVKQGKMHTNLAKDEIAMMDEVYDQIRVEPKTSMFCGRFTINQEVFKMFLDIRNEMYSFILEKNHKNIIPPEEQLQLLNCYYNNETAVVYDKIETVKKENKIDRVFKRFIQIGGTVIAVMIASSIALNQLPSKTQVQLRYNLDNIFEKDLTNKNKDYTYDDIIKAINSNENISQKEKKFWIESLEEEFEENKKYIDIETVIERLKKCQIKYHKKYTYNEKTNQYELTNPKRKDGLIANYNYNLNIINMYEDDIELADIDENYDKKEFDFNEANLEGTYFHETNHLLTIFGAINESILSREIINELFTREYFEKYRKNHSEAKASNGYVDKIGIGYALAEILSEETLRIYKYNDSSNFIISELSEIDNGNSEKAFEFITAINSIDLYNTLTQNEKEKQENNKKIHDSLAYFYKQKTGKNMSDDLIMLLYLYGSNFETKEEHHKVKQFLQLKEEDEIVKVIPKGYVSKSYQANHPDLIVQFFKDEQEFETHIHSKNRYLTENEIEK